MFEYLGDDQICIDEKFYQFLLYFFDKPRTIKTYDFLMHSEVFYKISNNLGNDNISISYFVKPDIYKKYELELHKIEEEIGYKIADLFNCNLHTISSIPDIDKFQILNNRYTPIETPWEEINEDQKRVIEQLRISKLTIEFQNIGNSCRTIMQKIADIVFVESIHIPTSGENVTFNDYKNRLHTYIKHELSGSSNKRLRDYSLSAIETTQKSIDLANKLTHALNANKLIAEACVISTFSSISIIKLVDGIKTS